MVTRKVGKYQVGRTVGEGTFAKVKFAQNTENGECVAVKILAKSTILKHRMVDQVNQGRLSENESRRFFQQLIDAVAHCHSKGVYHRDLKPENLLLDSHGNLKVSDFGLSALPLQEQGDGLLHTTCGTPNYLAPEITAAEYVCPIWLSLGATSLIKRLLDPNPRNELESIHGSEKIICQQDVRKMKKLIWMMSVLSLMTLRFVQHS
ncbi:hypothetical protein EUGRSUZ_C01522 [Eucalyptus grandis]|uniref:Uncharacterized protein n=1 Tax=Eucalyptus grandis TaxID=71139 RepID=A0ACC3LCJ4_EUCGR|nr:hypothetical protein EUGRSUZ_C01522 [Eucalyptus grandis]